MAALIGQIKSFIVERLACHESPKQVQASVQEQFKVRVSFSQLTAYNPERAAGRRMSPGLKKLFYATEEQFLNATSSLAISHKAWRMAQLQNALYHAGDTENSALALKVLEQAAKEMGGIYESGGRAKRRQVLERTGVAKDYTGRAR